jgi:CheY-like chemotaxis protein
VSVILTVEDEWLISLYVKQELEGAGFTVIAVANADEAIAVLEARNDIAVIVTDVDMPGSMDGLKLAAAVRDRWPPVKIIITSGKRQPDPGGMPAGSLFVPKPYGHNSLVDAVRQLA